MTQDNKNNNDSKTNESFADLLNDSFVDNNRLEPGQQVEAEIISISGEFIFINLGGKSEGHLEASELTNKEGNLTVKEGDTIKAYFMSAQNGEMHFTTKISGDKAGRAVLQQAHENEIPIEGYVEKEIKGGYEIKIGKTRAFCPYSQMGLERMENPEKYIGQHRSFRITEYKENGRNIILSSRVILEEEREAQVEAQKEILQPGMKVKGAVKSLHKFGAFVDIGGVQALLPISEISRDRIDDIDQALSVGQEIEAAIINLDWENEKISLSVKEILPDPWEDALNKYMEGSKHTGRIARIMNFGAFVSLEPGLDGLIHISDLGGNTKIKHPRDVVSEGQTIEVKVGKIDIKKKRIALIPMTTSKEEENYQQYMDNQESNGYNPLAGLGDLLKDKPDKKGSE